MLFQLVLVKLSAEQKTVKLLWVAYLSLPIRFDVQTTLDTLTGAPVHFYQDGYK